MDEHADRLFARGLAASVLIPVLMASEALAQDYPPTVTFSIDGHGPTIAIPDAFAAVPITEGDVLTPATGAPFGPYAPVIAVPMPPGTAISGGAGAAGPGLGLIAHSACIGHPPGSICPVELDALSYGRDFPLPAQILRPGTIWFSVDEYAEGAGPSVAPDVRSEGASGEQEAAGDMFVTKCPVGLAPLSSTSPVMGNVAAIDGDGRPNSAGIAYPGLGLVEPSPPGFPPDLGDNLDAVDVGTEFPLGGSPFPVYFSLDATFTDPLTGFPLSGTAAVQGVSGADVLVVSGVGAGPVVYASAVSLGLDIFGPNTDDLDGLALWENGTGIFQPSSVPHDWAGTGFVRDMLLFSVRRGSSVIGRPDSRFGLPIEPGDILSTPLPTALGGVSPFPSIFIAAEVLGLATARSGMGVLFGDELDALDTKLIPGDDCNNNCVPDKLDIKNGVLHDDNPMDCIADECQDGGGDPGCFCLAANAPCGNAATAAGCGNSTGFGAHLTATGSVSVSGDDLFLIMTPLPPFQFGIFYMGTNQTSLPFGDGLRCVSGSVFRFPVLNTGTPGTGIFGPMVGYANANFGAPGQITPGATWEVQGWFRDPFGP
ncbi:MAG: hypothetical protein E2O39_16945, partial [Planctomycetota bacterium]